MLIFGTALLALMAGALFYAARIPIESQPAPVSQPEATLKSRGVPSRSGSANDGCETTSSVASG